MLAWVVGAGGLLGQAVTRTVSQRFAATPVPWRSPDAAGRTLVADVDRFVSQVGSGDWSIVWAAGRSVVATRDEEIDDELAVFQRFVTAIGDRPPTGRGTFFLASSAGGVYAGSTRPPFDENTPPVPISPYGRAKLRQEELVQHALAGRVTTLIGRLTNVYGPGQNLSKPQGLVSQLCVAAATRRPINLFVPMETLRDYLYEDDAAAMIDTFVRTALAHRPDRTLIRNLASGRPTSVATVLQTVKLVSRRNVRVALGVNTGAGHQQRDLRVVPCNPDDLGRPDITPLPVGIKRVYGRVLLDLQAARFPAAG